MDDHRTQDDVLKRFYELTEARRKRERREIAGVFYRRIVGAASINPAKLSEQGQRILRWLAEWDEWTTDGLVEILTAAREAGRAEARGSTAEGTEPHRLARLIKQDRAAGEGRRSSAPEVEGTSL